MPPHVLGYLEVEAGVVDEDESVGLPLPDVPLCEAQGSEDGAQVKEHGHYAHIGKAAVVAEQRASLLLHKVAPDEAELRLLVSLP